MEDEAILEIHLLSLFFKKPWATRGAFSLTEVYKIIRSVDKLGLRKLFSTVEIFETRWHRSKINGKNLEI